MSRSAYELNPFPMIFDCLNSIQEWRKQAQEQKIKQRRTSTVSESQKLQRKIDEIIKQTRLEDLPEPTLIADLDSSEKAAKRISDIGMKVTRTEKIFKPEEVPLNEIMEGYIPTFKVDFQNIPEDILKAVGREISLVTREKLLELDFKGVDEQSRIFKGVIRVNHGGKFTDVVNVVALGQDGRIYIIHPDKHPRNICDAAAKRLQKELSKPIQDKVKIGLRKYYAKQGSVIPELEVRKEPILERETPG